MAVAPQPRNLTFDEAVKAGLAVRPKQLQEQVVYQTVLGGGDRALGISIFNNEIFKPEEFWKESLTKALPEFEAAAKATGVDDTLKELQKLIKQSTLETKREAGELKETSRRALRGAGGLLASAASPNLGTGGGASGPMLGGISELGGSSTLGMRGKL